LDSQIKGFYRTAFWRFLVSPGSNATQAQYYIGYPEP